MELGPWKLRNCAYYESIIILVIPESPLNIIPKMVRNVGCPRKRWAL
jgi:hypothetical protein